jgi:hypothetical protein
VLRHAVRQQKEHFIFIMEVAIYLKVCMKALLKIKGALPIIATAILSAFFCPVRSSALESGSSPVLPFGHIQADGAAGATVADRTYRFGWDTDFRFGLGLGMEIAAPAALLIRLAGVQDSGLLYVGVGVADLYINSSRDVLFQPSLMLAGYARFGPQAAFRGAFDISGAEKGIQRGEHPFWLRGSLALIFDMGQAATVAFGLSYQRTVVDGAAPKGLEQTGWAGDSRVSVGSVRTQPTADLPFFSVHIQPELDFIIIARVDINVDDRTTDGRCLWGFSWKIFSPRPKPAQSR